MARIRRKKAERGSSAKTLRPPGNPSGIVIAAVSSPAASVSTQISKARPASAAVAIITCQRYRVNTAPGATQQNQGDDDEREKRERHRGQGRSAGARRSSRRRSRARR